MQSYLKMSNETLVSEQSSEITSLFHHWKSERSANNIVWLTLDKKDTSTNTLSFEVLHEFEKCLDSLIREERPLGLVILSGKQNGFIAGADVKQFELLEDEEEAFKLIRHGQQIFEKLESLPFPTLALIQGFCLGGGLELALACTYRIAVLDKKTQIGLPEVKLGIHPGWGGSVRLPRLIGSLKAMDLILTGRTVSAKAAAKMGIVDLAVSELYKYKAAEQTILTEPKKHTPKTLEAISNMQWARPLLGRLFESQIESKINRAHYPAPFAVVDNWVKYGVEPEAYISEAKSVSELMMTETARNLLRVFQLQEKLKASAKDPHYKPAHIHVVGAGVMGGDIAAWCVLRGFYVTLSDENLLSVAKAMSRASALFTKSLQEPHLVRGALDRLVPDRENQGLGKADIIIEAIIENLEAKQALFSFIEQVAKKDAIFATNTSTIPLEEIGTVLKKPERLIGLHFFNPVAKMPLVEIVTSSKNDDDILKKTTAFARLIDKLPLNVKSSPGFLVNRILMPYLMEAIILLEEGVPPIAIDKAALEFGFPMGPVELADKVGIDICLNAAKHLNQYFGGATPVIIEKKVKEGHLGQKTGQGFYRYRNGKPIKEELDKNYRVPDDIIDRLTLRMLNEAVICLRENIVSDPDSLDAGMIFGAGFPPFRGGPMHYIQKVGAPLLYQRLMLLSERYGDRFKPDEGWHSLDE